MEPLMIFLWGVLCWTLTFLLTPAVRYLDRFDEKYAWIVIVTGTHLAIAFRLWQSPAWVHLVISGLVGGAWGVLFYRRTVKPRLDARRSKV